MAKEALFNILNNIVDFEHTHVLDLFSGTGSLSVEFASREVPYIVSVDKDEGCYRYLKSISEQYELTAIYPKKRDVLKFLKEETEKYDLIFADPPYDLPQIPEIPQLVFQRQLLNEGGLLIVEHSSLKKLDSHARFTEQRRYGYSSFSFFR